MQISRRVFSSMTLGTLAATCFHQGSAWGFQSQQSVSSRPYPRVTVRYVPGSFQARHSDLGGVLDTTTGLIWGYEPYIGMQNLVINIPWVLTMSTRYPALVQNIAQNDTRADRRALYSSTFDIISRRTWRAPTVFEARAAVAKGLFTVGAGLCNMYYRNPEAFVANSPGLSQTLFNLRWSTSRTSRGLYHAWSAGDGGTLVTSGDNSFHYCIVVSQL